ncbi:Carbonic anhydrase-related protein 10 [Halotydeus destructor]|nr:Carbonic anhydrase-related protein 10 [Halotydeus destructor]
MGNVNLPIDIVPSQLLFDPHLEDIQIAGSSLNVTVVSSGRGIRLQVYHDGPERVTISRGPFSYEYTLDHIIVHYGQDNGLGSEHSISGSSFPGENSAVRLQFAAVTAIGLKALVSLMGWQPLAYSSNCPTLTTLRTMSKLNKSYQASVTGHQVS